MVEVDRRVEQAEGFIRPRCPAEHCILAGDDTGVHLLARGNEQGGDIACADILTQRGGNLRADIRRGCVGEAASV